MKSNGKNDFSKYKSTPTLPPTMAPIEADELQIGADFFLDLPHECVIVQAVEIALHHGADLSVILVHRPGDALFDPNVERLLCGVVLHKSFEGLIEQLRQIVHRRGLFAVDIA